MASPPEGHTSASFQASLRAAPLPLLASRRVLSYPYEQVWPTAIRYLRIDRAFAIKDRDPDAGYILFEFPHPGSEENIAGQGSIEMFATVDPSGRPSVQISARASSGPGYLPHSLLDGIAKKLREERGQPAPPPPPSDPPTKPPTEPEDPPSSPGPSEIDPLPPIDNPPIPQ